MSLARAYKQRNSILIDNTGKYCSPSSTTSKNGILSIDCILRTSIGNSDTIYYTDSCFQAPHRQGDGRMSPHGSLLQLR